MSEEKQSHLFAIRTTGGQEKVVMGLLEVKARMNKLNVMSVLLVDGLKGYVVVEVENPKQIAIPYPEFQKQYLKVLWERRREFEKFQIILEATHHGPTSLAVPSVFVEVGTTLDQWNDTLLCARVADAVMETYRREMPKVPRAICFGGTHYPEKFTKMVLQGEYALGTIVPKHSLEYIDESMFSHILKSNPDTSTVLLDSGGLGKFKTDIISMAEASNLEVVKL